LKPAKRREDVIILVGVSEGDQALQTTFKALSACGFQTLFTNREQLDKIQKKVIIIGKHPKKRHNGKGTHRRRFALYQHFGFCAIGYAEGAEKEIDHLWWRDLFYKLRQIIESEVLGEDRFRLVVPLENLKEMGR
jgi:hypothetical protein